MYTTIPNPNQIPEEIKGEFTLENACCCSVHNFFIFLFRVRIKLYKISVMLDFIRRVASSLTKREEECGLKAFENKMPGRIFKLERMETQRGEEIL
jgi:hypothetical protein